MKRIILKPCSLINILGKRKIAFICAEIEIEPHKRSTNGANIIKCAVFKYLYVTCPISLPWCNICCVIDSRGKLDWNKESRHAWWASKHLLLDEWFLFVEECRNIAEMIKPDAIWQPESHFPRRGSRRFIRLCLI